jgi:cob(I)alamin adenosyltransferase
MPKKTLIQISTKTGDRGETGLASGHRLAKDAIVFEVVGTLDELNSWLGVVLANVDQSFMNHSKKNDVSVLKERLYHIQDTLFFIGAEVAGSPKAKLDDAELKDLEKWSDGLQLKMADNWTTQFLLPGGSQLGAWLDITRTVCRRCERVLVTYSREVAVRAVLLQYLNRLSDYLYVLRCWVNQELAYDEKPFKSTYQEKFLSKS